MTASLLTQFQMLGRYNRLANDVLYDACRAIPREELVRPQLAFFGSILGTLNHILVVDRIWMDRFTQTDREPPALDAVLYPDFDELRAARGEEDTRIEEFLDGLKIAFLSSRFRYKDHTGQFRQDGADLLVMHFFNHQTHHRGQVHDMLTHAGVKEISLDMHRLIHPAAGELVR